jgi:hypothetical protein
MTGVSGQVGWRSAELVRLLAPWSALAGSAPEAPFVERLSRWVHWTDAIALSAALGAAPAATGGRPDAGAAEAAARVQADLAEAIAGEAALSAVAAEARSEPDFTAYRRHFVESQRTMDTALTALRARLRQALPAAGQAELAALDAAMEQALAPRERALLGAVPVLAERRFQALRENAEAGDAWRARWLSDMRQLLLAELEFRLQPLQGLLEALQPPPRAHP